MKLKIVKRFISLRCFRDSTVWAAFLLLPLIVSASAGAVAKTDKAKKTKSSRSIILPAEKSAPVRIPRIHRVLVKRHDCTWSVSRSDLKLQQSRRNSQQYTDHVVSEV